MNKMQIDVQAISTSPLQYYYALDAELGRKITRTINERLAEITATHPDRFAPLATLPMQSPELAVAELEYAMKKLNFKGIEIGTNVNGLELADPQFESVFARAEELGALIFLHPAGFTDPRRISKHFLANIVGNPLDTTLALNHIVFGGVLERHPKLKFVAAHGGGYAGHYPARMDHAYRVRPECHDFITQAADALHEEDLLRHHGLQPRAARASGQPVGRRARRHRHRLPLRHGLLQAGRLRE